MFFVCHPKISEILQKHCFQSLLGPFKPPRETEENAHAKFWDDKQRASWYVMVFSEVVNCESPCVSLSFPGKYAKFYLILILFLLLSICP